MTFRFVTLGLALALASSGAQWGRLPLTFVAQQRSGISTFVSHAPGMRVEFGPGAEARLLTGPRGAEELRIMLPGAFAAQGRGTDAMPGKMHHFRGERSAWKSAVPMFRSVEYNEVYPGIDARYYGSEQQVEYDFLLAPGADPKRIRMRFSGQQALSLDRDGSLALRMKDGVVRQHKPVTYQIVDGMRREVPSRYRLLKSGEVAFALGSYDRSKPLVIDPVLTYSVTAGIAAPDVARAAAVDQEGNLYVLGEVTWREGTISDFGDTDAVLLKIDPTGTTLLYGAYIGGSGADRAYAIAVDADGHAYIAGQTMSAEGFPITSNAYATAMKAPHPADAFLMKINTRAEADESLIYSTFFNATSATGIALDSEGNVYITGETTTGLPTTPGAWRTESPGSPYHADAYAAKFDLRRDGEAGLVYSTYLGGTTPAIGFEGWDRGKAIAVDGEGNAIIVGETTTTDFPLVNAIQTRFAGYPSDGFVTKLNADGSALAYSTYLGGDRLDVAQAVAVDAAGNAYITGTTTSPNFPVSEGAFQREWNAGDCGTITEFLPCSDAFVAKFDPEGQVIWSTFLGGQSHDRGLAIAADAASGMAAVTGYALSSNFPVLDPLEGGGTGASLGFVTLLDAEGTPVFSSYIGAGDRSEVNGVAVRDGSIYFAGSMTLGNNKDAFLGRIADVVPVAVEEPEAERP